MMLWATAVRFLTGDAISISWEAAKYLQTIEGMI
jgi:hypothetical protein